MPNTTTQLGFVSILYANLNNDQRRICFRWQGEDALDVKIVDYH
jgi:plasmid maintenance system killer protein